MARGLRGLPAVVHGVVLHTWSPWWVAGSQPRARVGGPVARAAAEGTRCSGHSLDAPMAQLSREGPTSPRAPHVPGASCPVGPAEAAGRPDASPDQASCPCPSPRRKPACLRLEAASPLTGGLGGRLRPGRPAHLPGPCRRRDREAPGTGDRRGGWRRLGRRGLGCRGNGPASLHSCWLSLQSGAIWAFVAPALLVIVVGPPGP